MLYTCSTNFIVLTLFTKMALLNKTSDVIFQKISFQNPKIIRIKKLKIMTTPFLEA